jgi:hypothetical protein
MDGPGLCSLSQVNFGVIGAETWDYQRFIKIVVIPVLTYAIKNYAMSACGGVDV